MARKKQATERKRVWVAPKVSRLVAGKAENSPNRGLPDGDLNAFAS